MEPGGAERARAARVWTFRAYAERDAAARFERLARRLDEVGAEPVVVRMARAAASDELRHAELCAGLAERFGGAVPARELPPPREVAPAALGPRERVLYEVVAMACITETLSAAVLGEMLERAGDPAVREAVRSILRDEVGHARLGWAHVAAEHARGTTRVLSAYLPAMLAGTASEELFVAEPEPDPLRDREPAAGPEQERERAAEPERD